MIKRALESLNKPIKNFIFVAVEKEAPYAIGIYKLDDEALEFGANEFDTLMVELNKYIQKNEFPDYGIQTLSIPAWLKTE
jgi:exodeoxyribonuclease VIII